MKLIKKKEQEKEKKIQNEQKNKAFGIKVIISRTYIMRATIH